MARASKRCKRRASPNPARRNSYSTAKTQKPSDGEHKHRYVLPTAGRKKIDELGSTGHPDGMTGPTGFNGLQANVREDMH